MWWRRLTPQQNMRRWATALWTTPLVMMFPLWFGTMYDPGLLLKYPDIFLVFFGLPFAAAAILYLQAARLDRKGKSGSAS